MAFVAKTILTLQDKASAALDKVAVRMTGKWQKTVRKWNRETAAFNRKVIGAVKTIGVLGAAAAGAGAALVKSHTDAADAIDTEARKLGLAAEAYQELVYAAKLANVEQSEFDRGMEKFTRSLGELKTKGTGPLAKWLEQTPAKFQRQVKGAKTTEEAFNLIVAAIDAIPDAQRKAVIAAAAFGRGADGFITIAEGGVPALAKLREEARKLDLVMSNETVAAGAKTADSINALVSSVGALKNEIGAQLVPVFKPLIDSLTKTVVANKTVIATEAARFFEAVGKAVAAIDWVPLIHGATVLVTKFADLVERVGAGKIALVGLGLVVGGKVAQGIMGAALAFGTLTKVLAGLKIAAVLNPVGAAAALLTTAAVLIWKNWEPLKEAFAELWDWIGDKFASGWKAVEPYVGWIVDGAKALTSIFESGPENTTGLAVPEGGGSFVLPPKAVPPRAPRANAPGPAGAHLEAPPLPTAAAQAAAARAGATEVTAAAQVTGELTIRLAGPGAAGARVEGGRTNHPGLRIVGDTGHRAMAGAH